MFASATMLFSCTKDNGNTGRAIEDRDLSNKANVQVINSTLGSQRTFVYADGQRLNGAALIYTNSTTNTGSGLTYALEPGLRSFMVRDTLGTSVQPVLTFAEDFQANQKYTIFLYDTMRTIKQKTVLNQIETPDPQTAHLRFANFVWAKNATLPNVDVFSKKLNQNIFTDVPYTDVTGFIAHPFGADSLFVRQTGMAANLASVAINPLPQEIYTLVYRGGGAFTRSVGVFENH